MWTVVNTASLSRSYEESLSTQPSTAFSHRDLPKLSNVEHPGSPVSVDQSDLQLIFSHNIILLGLEFEHIPGTVDVSSSQPVSSLRGEVDKSIRADVRGLREDLSRIRTKVLITNNEAKLPSFSCSFKFSGPPMMSVGQLPGWMEKQMTPSAAYSAFRSWANLITPTLDV